MKEMQDLKPIKPPEPFCKYAAIPKGCTPGQFLFLAEIAHAQHDRWGFGATYPELLRLIDDRGPDSHHSVGPLAPPGAAPDAPDAPSPAKAPERPTDEPEANTVPQPAGSPIRPFEGALWPPVPDSSEPPKGPRTDQLWLMMFFLSAKGLILPRRTIPACVSLHPGETVGDGYPVLKMLLPGLKSATPRQVAGALSDGARHALARYVELDRPMRVTFFPHTRGLDGRVQTTLLTNGLITFERDPETGKATDDFVLTPFGRAVASLLTTYDLEPPLPPRRRAANPSSPHLSAAQRRKLRESQTKQEQNEYIDKVVIPKVRALMQEEGIERVYRAVLSIRKETRPPPKPRKRKPKPKPDPSN